MRKTNIFSSGEAKEEALARKKKLEIKYVPIGSLRSPEYNPRIWSKEATEQLMESIRRHGLIDPLIINSAAGREGLVIGGNFRLLAAKELGYSEVPAVFIHVADMAKEKEICLRLNKNTGSFDWEALADFGEDFLKDIGFSTFDFDEIFPPEDHPEQFDLQKELRKLQIDKIEIEKGDVWEIGNSRLACGDSTIEADILRLMGDEKASMVFTDPPYFLDYLKGKKKKGAATEGFGNKRDRRYLETDVLPPDFTELWMANIAKVQKPDFSIIIFENPKNLRLIWNELEKHWKYRNTITWHVPNRMQGFSAKYKFFNKTDIALVGTGGKIELNFDPEADELFQNEYENALFATSGQPHWESYSKGKKICPTDFIEHAAGDKKSSGQEIIFGTKPLELLIPYIKVLTKRGDLILEPFGGSGSTAAAAIKMGRRCYVNEKSAVYVEVIRRRLELLTGLKAKRIIHGGK